MCVEPFKNVFSCGHTINGNHLCERAQRLVKSLCNPKPSQDIPHHHKCWRCVAYARDPDNCKEPPGEPDIDVSNAPKEEAGKCVVGTCKPFPKRKYDADKGDWVELE
jgi:hypothetical protein